MRIFDVTETKTVTLIHRIQAENKKDAISRMRDKDSTYGQVFLFIVEDDSEVEYEAKEVNEDLFKK